MINIKNIYHMLSYAYQNLNKGELKSIKGEAFENLHNLMAVILIKGITGQVKRGLHRDYIAKSEVANTLRGKINVTDSIKQNTMMTRRMVCEYNDFTENTQTNQILKTTIQLLVRFGDVKASIRKDLRKMELFFTDVHTLHPNKVKWQSIKYHRNNASYKMLVNICELIIKGMLMTTESGHYQMSQFLDDQQMYRLYEKFLLEYFKKEHPEYSPKASYIDWNVEDGMKEFLPAMKTDITMTNGEKTLIIDAKYYKRAMQTHTMFKTKTLISGNLYQMFTYVKNKDRYETGNVSGIILYAKTNEDIILDNDYWIGGNRISVKTLDLGTEWENITRQLTKIAGYLS